MKFWVQDCWVQLRLRSARREFLWLNDEQVTAFEAIIRRNLCMPVKGDGPFDEPCEVNR